MCERKREKELKKEGEIYLVREREGNKQKGERVIN